MKLILKPQEVAIDHPDSTCTFRGKLTATPAALEAFGLIAILRCHAKLMMAAKRHDGIDYLQVFYDVFDENRNLWFIDGEHVTALLPSDY